MRAARDLGSRESQMRDEDSDRAITRTRVVRLSSSVGARAANIFSSVFEGFSARLTPAQVRRLQADPAVEAIVADLPTALPEAAERAWSRSDPMVESGGRQVISSGFDRVEADIAPAVSYDGVDERIDADIAVLDTGILKSHPDLNVAGGHNCTNRYRARWNDHNGHGTHVAGIAAAKDNDIGTVGTAPGGRLWSVKVLDADGRGLLSWIVCGIDWLARRTDPAGRTVMEVANASLTFSGRSDDGDCGYTDSDPLHRAVCRATAKGIVFTAAAGNHSRNARAFGPAAYDEVITVSALNDYDGTPGGDGRWQDGCRTATADRDDTFADFSNFGADIDLIAPGRCIRSSYLDNKYIRLTGTSMAAPFVAGAAATYRSLYPEATAPEVKTALKLAATYDWFTATDPDPFDDRLLDMSRLAPPGMAPAAAARHERPAGPRED